MSGIHPHPGIRNGVLHVKARVSHISLMADISMLNSFNNPFNVQRKAATGRALCMFASSPPCSLTGRRSLCNCMNKYLFIWGQMSRLTTILLPVRVSCFLVTDDCTSPRSLEELSPWCCLHIFTGQRLSVPLVLSTQRCSSLLNTTLTHIVIVSLNLMGFIHAHTYTHTRTVGVKHVSWW